MPKTHQWDPKPTPVYKEQERDQSYEIKFGVPVIYLEDFYFELLEFLKDELC